MPSFHGIQYKHSSVEGPTYTFDAKRPTGSITIDTTSWSDAVLLAPALMGNEYLAGTGANVYIRRFTPFPDTVFYIGPNHTISGQARWYLYCVRSELKGTGFVVGQTLDAMDKPQYTQGRITVTLDTFPYEVREDGEITQTGGVPDESYWERYVSFVYKPQGEFLTVRSSALAGGFRWVVNPPAAGAAVVNTEGISKLISTCNFQVTWHRIPDLCVPSKFVNPRLTSAGAIESTIGKVNNASFNGFDTATLLLLGASMQPYRGPFGNRLYDITYFMKFNQFTHQKLLDTRSPPHDFKEVVVADNGATNLVNQIDGLSLYDYANFRSLFKPPA